MMDITMIKAIVLACSMAMCLINAKKKEHFLSTMWGFCSGFVAQSLIHGM